MPLTDGVAELVDDNRAAFPEPGRAVLNMFPEVGKDTLVTARPVSHRHHTLTGRAKDTIPYQSTH